MEDDNLMKLYVEKQQHHINCLLDPDRNIRSRGLDTLIKNIFPTSNEEIDPIYIKELLQKLISPLLKCFEDKIEKIRQMSIELVFRLLEKYTIDDKINSIIINTIISRLNHVPFIETCK
jgi:hypothetical protein